MQETIGGLETNPEEEGQEQEEAAEHEKGEDENGEKAELETADARRLYVGNLPYSMTSNQLAEIIYDRVTDRSRGFAFVTMGSVEEAQEAVRMFDGSQVGGRTVKVNFPEVPRGGERKGLRDAFAKQPGFLSAKVIYERDSGRSQGFGFVTFSSAEEAESALNSMNGVEVEGRALRLNMAAERIPSSSPSATVDFNTQM
ncbi:hypothetical protein Ancab_032419 [Ancistrocladus abbreviatus]